MKQETLQKVVFWAFVIVKALGLYRTTTDTWAVSHDIANVLLIDGVFAAMWIAAAYGGKSESAMAMRPFAALGAWIAFGFMVIIGWEAHRDATAFASRVSIGIVLSYDTWDMIRAAIQRMRIERKAETVEERMARVDRKAQMRAYETSMSKTRIGKLQEASDAIALMRIQQYAQRNLVLPASVPDNGYMLKNDGHIQCLKCGWISGNTYPDINKAQPVYAAHTRAASHRGAMARVIDEVDVTE